MPPAVPRAPGPKSVIWPETTARRAAGAGRRRRLSNAVKFTPCGGTLQLGCTLLADAACFVVRDSGIGIPPDKLSAIFEPFVQVRSNLTRTSDGTGLGLAISRDLARGMGGDLLVESVPGHGSVFKPLLPVAGPARSR